MKKIKIEEYDPKWAHGFNELKKAYLEHIREDLIIEHIGSTSVPGLSANPIIDIDIIIKSKKEFNIMKEKLEDLGYEYKGNLGVEGREVFHRLIRNVPLLKEHHSKWYPHHLFVCYEGSLVLKSHLKFKEYLMSHEDTVNEYSELKIALAHKYVHDIEGYASEKKAFIDRILKLLDFTDEELKKL